jgi:uncharacterized damage-inducible protein DinB
VTLMKIGIVSTLCLGLLVGAVPSIARAQDKAANSFTSSVKSGWDNVKKNVSNAATQMPENEYSFKPVPEVRSFGQIVGHLANEHYAICSAAKGEKNPNSTDFEKTTAKADLMKGLTDSITYCDGVFAAASDATAMDQVDLFGSKFTKFRALLLNVTHDNEHYGNFVTYMRLKGHVPPTSAGTR